MLKHANKLLTVTLLYSLTSFAFADNFGGYEIGVKIGADEAYGQNFDTAKAVSEGLETGYNWLLNEKFLIGIVGGYDYNDAVKHKTSIGNKYFKYGSSITSVDMLAGYVFNDSELLYLKAGNAYMQGIDQSRPYSGVGFNAALGIDFNVSENASWGLEVKNIAVDKNEHHWANNLVDVTYKWHF